MKRLTGLYLNNFAKYREVSVNLDDVTYLVGLNGSGKTTLGLDSIWFIMQGIAQKGSKGTTPLPGERFRFIGEHGKSAEGSLFIYDEENDTNITVYRKLTKDGTQLEIIPEDGDYPETLDQQWLNKLFNIFLINPQRFIDLTPTEQAKALNIDTSKFDDKIADFKQEYRDINRDYKNLKASMMRESKPEPGEKVDIEKLKKQKEEIRKKLNNKYKENAQYNRKLQEEYNQKFANLKDEIQDHNDQIDEKKNAFKSLGTKFEEFASMNDFVGESYGKTVASGEELSEIRTKIKDLNSNVGKRRDYETEKKQIKAPEYIQELPDQTELTEIEKQIEEAQTHNQKVEQEERDLKLWNQLQELKDKLDKNKENQGKAEKEKNDYISSKQLPFKGLEIDESGQLLYQGKPLKPTYFSDGELFTIVPILMSSQKPDLRYVFLQRFNLLDEKNQEKIEKRLTDKGMQLVIEYIGDKKPADKNAILLKDCKISGDEENGQKEELL